MAVTQANPFPSDALEANRGGQLTTEQRDRLRPIARYTRQSTLIAAVIFVAAAVMMVRDRQLSVPDVFRVPLAGACLAVATVLLVRAVVGGDALTRDLRHMRVQAIDGAVGKRSQSYGGRGRGRRSYWLDVGDGTFRVSHAGYDAAPEAGMVRIYFLPRSRRAVNMERLPDAQFAPGTTTRDVLASMGAAVRAGSRREMNEARAKMAPMVDAMKAADDASLSPPPADARDPRPLAQAIVGTWTSVLMTVAFEADGSVTATMFGGMQRRGRWSVDGAGRLSADVTGQREAVQAWVVGDELTLSADGRALRFTRR